MGGINGLYQIIADILAPVRKKVKHVLCLHDDLIATKILHGLVIFILVDFSWIFFRASRLKEAISVIKSIFTIHNPWILFDGSLYNCGLDIKNFHFMWVSIGILVLADICKKSGIIIRQHIRAQDFLLRTFIIAFCIVAVLLFGIYGNAYNESNLIYFQF